MGLGGRKTKQRIGNDPRNLSWADDAARFGSSYLSKFGWDASKGLGAEGDGRTSHLKVAQKLDMMGIGAAHQKDPNGIAWKQNKDFENLLRRLNASAVSETTQSVQVDVEQVVEKTVVEVDAMDVDKEESSGDKEKKRKEKSDKKERKEKKKAEEKEKKKSKKDKDGKRKREEDEDEADTHKKAKTLAASEDSTPAPTPSSTEVTDAGPSEIFRKAYVPRHRAHRARAIAAKSISSKSTVHISEILGVSSSTSPSGSATPADPNQGKLTVIDDEPQTLEKLTTSTKSVADYFKDKLLAKSNLRAGTSTPSTLAESTSREDDEVPERPMGGLGFSRLRFESQTEEESMKIESDTFKMGMSKFSSLMSATFMSNPLSFAPAAAEPTATIKEVDESSDSEDEDEEQAKRDRKEAKRLRKEEKAKKKADKAEKKRLKAEAKARDSADSTAPEKEKKKSKKKQKKEKESS